MHGLMPECKNCAGSFPYSYDFACIVALCTEGSSGLFPSSGALSCLIPGRDGHFGCREWGA